MHTELQALHALLQDLEAGNHPAAPHHPPNCKEHLIRALQNRIAEIHLQAHLITPEQTLSDQLHALPFKTLDRYVSAFNETGLTVPRVLWEARDSVLQKESLALLKRLIEDESTDKPTTKQS